MPLGVNRTYVKYVEVGTFPQVAARLPGDALQPVRRRAVRRGLPDRARCTAGATASSTSTSRSASAARPASRPAPTTPSSSTPRTTRPRSATSARTASTSASSRRASWCARREAILVGDLERPDVARGADRRTASRCAVRRPEKETQPKLFYIGAHQATLDPLAARRPDGGLFMWSEQAAAPRPGGLRPSRESAPNSTSSAAALLAYDVPHAIPWDWRVEPLHADQGHRRGRLPGRAAAGARRRAARRPTRCGPGRRRCSRWSRSPPPASS